MPEISGFNNVWAKHKSGFLQGISVIVTDAVSPVPSLPFDLVVA